LGKFLKQNDRPAKFSYSFYHNDLKGDLKIYPRLKPKVPVCLWLALCTITMICWGTSLRAVIQGVKTGGNGHNTPGDEPLWWRRITAGGGEKF